MGSLSMRVGDYVTSGEKMEVVLVNVIENGESWWLWMDRWIVSKIHPYFTCHACDTVHG